MVYRLDGNFKRNKGLKYEVHNKCDARVSPLRVCVEFVVLKTLQALDHLRWRERTKTQINSSKWARGRGRESVCARVRESDVDRTLAAKVQLMFLARQKNTIARNTGWVVGDVLMVGRLEGGRVKTRLKWGGWVWEPAIYRGTIKRHLIRYSGVYVFKHLTSC